MTQPQADAEPEYVWEQGWEDHERQQARRLAKLPLSEKLAWLEQAQRLVRHLDTQRDRIVDRHSRPENER